MHVAICRKKYLNVKCWLTYMVFCVFIGKIPCRTRTNCNKHRFSFISNLLSFYRTVLSKQLKNDVHTACLQLIIVVSKHKGFDKIILTSIHFHMYHVQYYNILHWFYNLILICVVQGVCLYFRLFRSKDCLPLLLLVICIPLYLFM